MPKISFIQFLFLLEDPCQLFSIYCTSPWSQHPISSQFQPHSSHFPYHLYGTCSRKNSISHHHVHLTPFHPTREQIIWKQMFLKFLQPTCSLDLSTPSTQAWWMQLYLHSVLANGWRPGRPVLFSDLLSSLSCVCMRRPGRSRRSGKSGLLARFGEKEETLPLPPTQLHH